VRFTGFGILLAVCLWAPATFAQSSPIKFPDTAVTYARPADARQTMLFRPSEGAGPYPAIVLMHQCGGPHHGMFLWAERVTKAGFAALVIDSHTPRGLQVNCDVWKVSVEDFLVDAAAAFAYLRKQTIVNGNALALMGFSFGAMTGLRVASADVQKRLGIEGLRAVVAYYPQCETASSDPRLIRNADNLKRDHVTPTIAFFGAIDDETPPKQCTSRMDNLKAQGAPIDYKVYPDTTHSFDNFGWGTEGKKIGRYFYRYNPAATDDSWALARIFLDRELKGAK
jgi:dienelactone hydrolase